MTDLEITRLCAEAMGLKHDPDRCFGFGFHVHGLYDVYNPLTDDAQAMALLMFLLSCGKHIIIENNSNGRRLRRAICECVAQILSAKK
mgnify:CR=1 FL=1